MTFQNHLKGYQLVFSDVAKKALKKLDKPLVKKIESKLEDLINGDQNLDIKKLQAYKEPTYRLRVGDMRVLYAVWHQKVIIYVIDIGHRREIYE